MLTRLVFAATLAGVLALPAVPGTQHGGSGIVGATRVGDLRMGVSTEADVRAFAGNPDIVDDNSPYPWVKWLGYNCRDRACRTYYQINTDDDTLFGFETYSRRWFHTRRGTRVGDTRRRAERRERRKANHDLCGMGTPAILREHDGHSLYILFNKRRVFAIVADSTSVDC